MKTRKITGLFFVYLIFASMVGCSKDYQVEYSFTGTIEEKLIAEKILVMKEDEATREGEVYEIPVDNVEQYDVGQKLKITILSNTDVDVWDLNHMKFEIEKLEG
ncbi:hypothetical protein VBD025_14950 [Virgibacillus flavescens]|uniref:hypothetical protein n=1 Tax=Virgibacillus flavescens TaxID=1611422 RepID=UPI003D342A7B